MLRVEKLILRLAREKKIVDLDKVAQTNHVAVTMTSNVLPSTMYYDKRESLVKFGTFEPIVVWFQQKILMTDSQSKDEPVKDDGEGWILVTRRKKEI